MNRIVLIGNGFDLAHGLKTSYADFINWYWKNRGELLLKSHKRIEEDRLCCFKLLDFYHDWYYVWNVLYRANNPFKPWTGLDVVDFAKQQEDLCDFSFGSLFFQKICEDVEKKKWVDIEDVFYGFLTNKNMPKKYNDDLDYIKGKLIEYLSVIQHDFINGNIFKQLVQNQILEPIKKEDIAINSQQMYCDMVEERVNYSDEKWKYLIDGYNINRINPQYDVGYIHRIKESLKKEIERVGALNVDDYFFHKTFFLPDNIMLLDFNYTNTTDLYIPKADKFTVNHIHGSLSNPECVVFGYGDELDTNYKVLLDKKDNEYLRNIKSIRYQEVPNYRNMLRFIESSPYQIYIMGHSCGNSDRTMLNTLFEHRNCVSIKPFYHKWDDGTDNYMEIVQNIARNFTDMKLMRDRVVNKTFCETI